MDRNNRINTKVEDLEFIENLGTGSVYYPISQELRDRGITWWFITPLAGNIQDASLLSAKNRNGALVQFDYQWRKLSYWNGVEKGMAEIPKGMTVREVMEYMEKHVETYYTEERREWTRKNLNSRKC